MDLIPRKFKNYTEFYEGENKYACLQHFVVAGREYWVVSLTPYNESKQQIFGSERDAEAAIHLLHKQHGKA